MDPVIEKLVTNGSALAVLVVVVWLFLTHLKDTRKEDRATMLNMHEQHLEARKESQIGAAGERGEHAAEYEGDSEFGDGGESGGQVKGFSIFEGAEKRRRRELRGRRRGQRRNDKV
jgi:hypothetical protein